MKIDLEDHSKHVSRVKKMLEYFDILDQIDLSSEEITSQQKSLTELRKDEFIPNDKSVIAATTDYSSNIVCAVEKENIFGTQFHPEKSSKQGLELIKNFLKL